MALNLADTADIMTAYEAVLANELNWFLLYYPGTNFDELALYAFGSDGLEELKTKIDPDDPEKVVIGFLRADETGETGEVKFLLMGYVPRGVTGVRRARAKVHIRRLGMIFKKHDAVLSAEDLSQLTNATIAHTLAEPDPSILTFSAPGGAGAPTASPTLITAPPSTTGSSIVFSTSPPASPLTAVDMGRSFSQPDPNPATSYPPPSNLLRPVQRSYSETYTPAPQPGHPSGPAQRRLSPPMHQKLGSNMFSNLLRRKKRSASTPAAREIDESQESDDSMPPPTPPKDKGVYATRMSMPGRHEHELQKDEGYDSHPPHHHHHRATEYTYRPPFSVSVAEDEMTDGENFGLPPTSFHHQQSISEFAVISHEEASARGDGPGEVVVIRPEEFGFRYQKPLPLMHNASTATLRKGKWAEPQGLSAIKDPAERARMRMEIQRQKEEEEREVIRAEEERQERKRREKEEFLRREEEEEERRKAAIQAEALRVAAERRRKEELERQEEERRAREREEKKRLERHRKLEEHQRLEEWRREQQRITEEHARMEEEARKKEEIERRKKILKAEDDVKRKAKSGAMTGWVTIQTDESVVWKRRYYKFVQDTLHLFRTAKDTDQVTEKLDVRGSVRALKEPKEGYEELEAIPFSFAVEFRDRGSWSMFTDSEEEKFKLLGLLHHAAGLSA